MRKHKRVFLASLGASAVKKSFSILSELRSSGIVSDGLINDGQSLKSQMRLADKLGMDFCVIIGDRELEEDSAVLRDLRDHSQMRVPFSKLLETLKAKIEISDEH